MTLPLDDEVVEGVRARDPDALVAVWQSLAPQLLGWLRMQLRNAQDAEDVAMETMCELVRDADRIAGGAAQLRSWVFRAAYHNLLDLRRTRSRRPEDPTDVLPEEETADDPARAAQAADLRTRMAEALDWLTPDQAAVLRLRFVGQLSAPEIAEVLGRSEGAVRQLQHRGTTRLAQMVRDGTVRVEPGEAP